jgi:hypothetical protein
MVIQVRSVPESQEWEVIVEPSTEASRPTRMLVHESNSRGSSRRAGDPGEPDKTARTTAKKPTTGMRGIFIFLMARSSEG